MKEEHNDEETDDPNFQVSQLVKEVDLPGILFRTVSDLQMMKINYEEGLKVYNTFLGSLEMTGELEAARQLMAAGLEIHVSLINFVKSARQLVHLATTGDIEEVQQLSEIKEKLSSEEFKNGDGLEEMSIKVESTFEMCGDIKTEDSVKKEETSKTLVGADSGTKENKVEKKKRKKEEPKLKSARVKKEKKSFPCEFCGKVFDMRSKLKEHLIAHSDLAPHQCNICQKGFKYKNQRNAHERDAHNCKYCGEQFVSLTDKRRHQNSKHPELRQLKEIPENKKIICDWCGFTTDLQIKLKRHMLQHTGEKPYKCEICGQGFTSNYTLKHHTYLHTGEMPFECDVCGRRFRRNEQLHSHYRLHTGEKPFKCDVCGKAFHLSNERNKHVRKAHGVDKIENPPPVQTENVS